VNGHTLGNGQDGSSPRPWSPSDRQVPLPIGGHAYGVFQALHDAYDDGTLKLGMPVVYAESHGRLHLYRVTTWRIVHPTEVGWAIAAQPVPSMTLQTCVGSKGTLRLNVRLVEATA